MISDPLPFLDEGSSDDDIDRDLEAAPNLNPEQNS
jgi:hypothetical protein